MRDFMKKTKKCWSLFLVLAVAMMISGCAQKSMSTDGSSVSSLPAIVKNADGEEVKILSEPKRIVVLPVWAAEMVLDMVNVERITALSNYMDNPVLTSCADKARSVKTRISSEAEAVIGQQPDLVLLDTFNDPQGNLSKTLTDAGITVLKLASPTSFADVRNRLGIISKAVFAVDEGQKLVEAMDKKLNMVAEKVKTITSPRRVMYYEDYYSPDGTSAGMLCAYGAGSPFQAIVEAAGAVNVCTADNYSAVSKETVINDWKPELFIVPGITYGENYSVAESDGSAVLEAMKKDAVLQSLPAVQKGQVVALTEKYRSSTSHYMADAVVELAKVCYPDKF